MKVSNIEKEEKHFKTNMDAVKYTQYFRRFLTAHIDSTERKYIIDS